MWLWEAEEAQVDFILLPTPPDLLTSYDDPERYIGLVEQIPQRQRITTVTVKRDDEKIERIKERVAVSQNYYQQIIETLGRN
nr:hypothetical protein [Lonepinella koalarum]